MLGPTRSWGYLRSADRQPEVVHVAVVASRNVVPVQRVFRPSCVVDDRTANKGRPVTGRPTSANGAAAARPARMDSAHARVLTQRLRRLERDGLVARTYHAEGPPRVEYEITELGASLGPLFANDHLG